MTEKVAMIARINPKTGATDKLRSVLVSMLEPTRREAGCIVYNLHEPVTGSEVIFSFYEIWRSQQDLDRHMQTEHVHRLIDHLDELVDGEIVLERLTLLEP